MVKPYMRIPGLLAICSVTLLGQDLQVKNLERTVIEDRFTRVRSDEAERASTLLEMFAQA